MRTAVRTVMRNATKPRADEEESQPVPRSQDQTADVIDLALARGGESSGGESAPAETPPATGERGFATQAVFYAVENELFDYRRPHVRELDRMLEHDPYAGAIEKAIILPLLRAALRINEPEKGDKGQTDLVRTNLLGSPQEGGMTTPITQIRQQMASAVFRRRAFFEKVLHPEGIVGGRWDGATAYHKLAFRPAETCRVRIDKNGTFNGFVQEGFRGPKEPLKELFGPDKSFVYIHDQATRPLEGRGAGDAAFTQYIDKLKVKRLWFAHLQDKALGTIKGSYTGTDPQGVAKLRNALLKMRGGGVWVKDGQHEDAELMESSRDSQEFLDALHFLNGEMGVSVLAMFLGLGKQGDRGSWALSRDQSDFFLQSLEAILQEMAKALNDWVIAPLVRWNFGADAAIPQAEFAPLSMDTKAKALEVYQAIVVAPQHHMRAPLLDSLEQLAFGFFDLDAGEILEAAEEKGEDVSRPVQQADEDAPGGEEVSAGSTTPPALGEADRGKPAAGRVGSVGSSDTGGAPAGFLKSVGQLQEALVGATSGEADV